MLFTQFIFTAWKPLFPESTENVHILIENAQTLVFFMLCMHNYELPMNQLNRAFIEILL